MKRNRALPKKIKIGRKKYKARHVAKKTSMKELDDMGECDYSQQVITLFGNQQPTELSDTLIHECLHGMISAHNVKFKNRKEEEKYVRRFTELMVSLFKNNKPLFKYLETLLY